MRCALLVRAESFSRVIGHGERSSLSRDLGIHFRRSWSDRLDSSKGEDDVAESSGLAERAEGERRLARGSPRPPKRARDRGDSWQDGPNHLSRRHSPAEPSWTRATTAAAAVRQRSTVQTFLFVLLTLYVAKQGINVIAFKPFTGHDEIAHYAYLRTVATEGRLPVLPDLDEFRAAVQPGEPQHVDQLPTELYPYCRYTLNWFCAPFRFRDQPPRMVTYLNRYYPDGFQYAANHPPLYYVIMTPLYWASAQNSPETQQYLLRLAAIPFGIATVVLAFLLARYTLSKRHFFGDGCPHIRGISASNFVRSHHAQ